MDDDPTHDRVTDYTYDFRDRLVDTVTDDGRGFLSRATPMTTRTG